MTPLEPPLVIDKGIGLYSPLVKDITSLRLEIYFSTTNPLLSFASCSSKEHKLWEVIQLQSPTGTLFLYQAELDLGFYTLVLSNEVRDMRGSITLGVLRPTNRIVVGLPYSIYPPIELTR
jgi:hypothetical protein